MLANSREISQKKIKEKIDGFSKKNLDQSDNLKRKKKIILNLKLERNVFVKKEFWNMKLQKNYQMIINYLM